MRVFKAILSAGNRTNTWIIIIRKNYRRCGWKIKGIRIYDGLETDAQDIPATEIFTAIKIWAESRPGTFTILTYGEIKLQGG